MNPKEVLTKAAIIVEQILIKKQNEASVKSVETNDPQATKDAKFWTVFLWHPDPENSKDDKGGKVK